MDAADELGKGLPVHLWPTEIDEPVELLVVHDNLKWAKSDDRHEWYEWCKGYWTDFNGGGWVWNGLCGRVIWVRPRGLS